MVEYKKKKIDVLNFKRIKTHGQFLFGFSHHTLSNQGICVIPDTQSTRKTTFNQLDVDKCPKKLQANLPFEDRSPVTVTASAIACASRQEQSNLAVKSNIP